MKLISILILALTLFSETKSQVIKGKVIDTSTGEALEYVSIGVVNTSLGTITDENGNFNLNVTGQSPTSIIRISMISYEPQTFTITELSVKESIIKLISAPTQLAEIIIKPTGRSRKVGTTSYTRIGNWCGWGGSHNRKGCEIGTKIELGTTNVQIKSLHVHVQRQAFDSSLYRLHIRNIVGNLPQDELLNNNILLSIKKESGWVDIDLRKYNIVLKGDVALTLEWVDVFGVNANRKMKIDDKMTSAYVLFNQKKGKGNIYTRWGTEAKWNSSENGSPSIYMIVLD